MYISIVPDTDDTDTLEKLRNISFFYSDYNDTRIRIVTCDGTRFWLGQKCGFEKYDEESKTVQGIWALPRLVNPESVENITIANTVVPLHYKTPRCSSCIGADFYIAGKALNTSQFFLKTVDLFLFYYII